MALKLGATGWPLKRCIIQGRLDGKTFVVTGANTGIGLATTGELTRRGAHVIMACRHLNRAEEGKQRLLNQYTARNPRCLKANVADSSVLSSLSPITEDQFTIEHLELTSLQSVRDFVKRINQSYTKLDGLINNAGMPHPYGITEEGFERTMGVNHLGHFLLTELLLPQLQNGAPSRIIMLSSAAHRFASLHRPDLLLDRREYGPWKAYCQSKLANLMHAKELGKRLQGTGISVASVSPGAVRSETVRDCGHWFFQTIVRIQRPFFTSTWQGAQTVLFTLLTPDLISGAYYANCSLARVNRIAEDPEACEWLWNKSNELVDPDNKARSV